MQQRVCECVRDETEREKREPEFFSLLGTHAAPSHHQIHHLLCACVCVYVWREKKKIGYFELLNQVYDDVVGAADKLVRVQFRHSVSTRKIVCKAF